MGSYEALVQQLHSGSPSKKHQQAVASLLDLPLTPRNWLSAVSAIPRLVQLMYSSQTAAPRALVVQQLLQHISEYQGMVEAAPEGVIPPLVPLLLHRDGLFVRHVAAQTLSNLVLDVTNQRKIIEAGAAAPLVQLLKSGSEALQTAAASALLPLAFRAQAESIAAGAIETLVSWLNSNSADLQMAAVPLLVDLSCENAAGQDRVAAAGAIGPVVRLLQAESGAGSREHAVMLLANLAYRHAQPLIAAGAIPPLVKRLTGSPLDTQMAPCTASQTIPAPKLRYWRRIRSSPWCAC